jgi:hypothetical protein
VKYLFDRTISGSATIFIKGRIEAIPVTLSIDAKKVKENR